MACCAVFPDFLSADLAASPCRQRRNGRVPEDKENFAPNTQKNIGAGKALRKKVKKREATKQEATVQRPQQVKFKRETPTVTPSDMRIRGKTRTASPPLSAHLRSHARREQLI